MDVGAILLIGMAIITILVALIVLDLLYADGARTTSLMDGTARLASNPIGQGILPAPFAILGILIYALFFR